MIKKLPHTFVIIFYLILIAAAMTWVIPGGKYTEEIVTISVSEYHPYSWQHSFSENATYPHIDRIIHCHRFSLCVQINTFLFAPHAFIYNPFPDYRSYGIQLVHYGNSSTNTITALR